MLVLQFIWFKSSAVPHGSRKCKVAKKEKKGAPLWQVFSDASWIALSKAGTTVFESELACTNEPNKAGASITAI